MPGLGGYWLSSSLQVLEHDDFLSILSQFHDQTQNSTKQCWLYDNFLKCW